MNKIILAIAFLGLCNFSYADLFTMGEPVGVTNTSTVIPGVAVAASTNSTVGWYKLQGSDLFFRYYSAYEETGKYNVLTMYNSLTYTASYDGYIVSYPNLPKESIRVSPPTNTTTGIATGIYGSLTFTTYYTGSAVKPKIRFESFK